MIQNQLKFLTGLLLLWSLLFSVNSYSQEGGRIEAGKVPQNPPSMMVQQNSRPIPPPPHGKGMMMRPSPREVLEQLRQEKPEEYKRLMELRNRDRKLFFEELRKHMQARSNVFNQIIQKERENRRLAQQIRAAKDEAERAKLTEELRARLKNQFSEMIEETEKRLHSLQLRLDEMKDHREEIQQKRFEELVSGKNPPSQPSGESPARN